MECQYLGYIHNKTVYAKSQGRSSILHQRSIEDARAGAWECVSTATCWLDSKSVYGTRRCYILADISVILMLIADAGGVRALTCAACCHFLTSPYHWHCPMKKKNKPLPGLVLTQIQAAMWRHSATMSQFSVPGMKWRQPSRRYYQEQILRPAVLRHVYLYS